MVIMSVFTVQLDIESGLKMEIDKGYKSFQYWSRKWMVSG
jgi:hypothetical protein